jgi:UDP-glucose 4-epimerase
MDKNVTNGMKLLAVMMETDISTILFQSGGSMVCQMHERTMTNTCERSSSL